MFVLSFGQDLSNGSGAVKLLFALYSYLCIYIYIYIFHVNADGNSLEDCFRV